jgi:hypothetical protein
MGVPTAVNEQFKPYDQPTYSQVYGEFCGKVLHKTPDEMSQYWANQTFKGLASSPSQLSSLDELFGLIQNYPNVIGYVDSDQVPASYLKNVRIYYSGPVTQQAPSPAPVSEATEPVVEKPVSVRKEPTSKPVSLVRDEAPGLWGEVLSANNLGDYDQDEGVTTQINQFERDGDLQERVDNATPYIKYVYTQAEKMGVPAQFALLPLMESNYNPYATNRNGAGLWQLERATAKVMNIPVNDKYDGRRDVAVSTHAALQHLLDEFSRFHNWQLATAAYNCGTGPVEKALKYNLAAGKPTNFWAIRSQLPKITQDYVPRLIALSYMLNHASHYNIKLPDLSTRTSLKAVDIRQPLTMNELSQLSGTSIDYLKELNPGLVLDKTPADQTYQLLLPASSVSDFNANLASLNDQQSRQLAQNKAQKAKEEALLEEKQLAQAKGREAEKKDTELAPYEVTHVATKATNSDDNLKSLLSKIYS